MVMLNVTESSTTTPFFSPYQPKWDIPLGVAYILMGITAMFTNGKIVYSLYR